MGQFDTYKEDLAFFVEAGLVAIKQGDEDSAKKLFNAIAILDPKNSAYKTGLGLIALHKMDLKAAEKYFQEVVAVEPQNYRTKAFLGFTYVVSVAQNDFSQEDKVQRLKWGMEIANEVLAKAEEPVTKQMAKAILNWEEQMHAKGTAMGGKGG